MPDFLAPVNWTALLPPRHEPVRKRVEQPVVIMKRVEAPSLKENTMDYDDTELVLKAERLIREGRDFAEAERAVRDVELLAKRSRHKIVVTHDDSDPADTWSEPSDAASPGNNADGDEADDGDDEEDDGIPMRTRKSHQGNYTLTEGGHSRMVAPRSSVHAANPRATGVTPAVQQPKRHKFDALVEKMMREQNVNKTSAMRLVRQFYPEIFMDYNRAFTSSSNSAQQQQFSRSGINEYAKRAPVSRESLIATEMAKGCNAVVAEQRVMHMYGNAIPPSAISKGADDLVDQLQEKIESVCDETGCSLTEGQRWVGKAYPHLLKALR